MKPELLEVLEILKMKEEAKKLYDEVDVRINKLFMECGASRYDYDLNALPLIAETDAEKFGFHLRKETRYLKLEIVDNLTKLLDDGSFWKSVVFKAVSFSVRTLKRCPASLK